MATETEAKAMRLCIGCGQTDDHPRHTGTNQPWHMDCHVLATGCTDCEEQLAAAAGAQGDELQAHLISIRQEG